MAQVLSNMVDFGMEPQAALDAPRFRLEGVDSALGPASVKTSKCAPADSQKRYKIWKSLTKWGGGLNAGIVKRKCGIWFEGKDIRGCCGYESHYLAFCKFCHFCVLYNQV